MIERRPVVGFEGIYEVSAEGKIYRVASGMGARSGRELKPAPHSAGYLQVGLSSNCVQKKAKVHRLVAQAFIPNPANFQQINHRNGDKTDNRVENLEWCNNSHNQYHSVYTLDIESGHPRRPVRAIHMASGNTLEISSLSEAARFVHGNSGAVCYVCQGKLHHHKGWKFEYLPTGMTPIIVYETADK